MNQELYLKYREFLFDLSNKLNEIGKKPILYFNEEWTKLRDEVKLDLHEKMKELRVLNQRVLDDLKFDFKDHDFDKFRIACSYYEDILAKSKNIIEYNLSNKNENEKSLYILIVANKVEGEEIKRFDLNILDFELFVLMLINQLLENIDLLKGEILEKFHKKETSNKIKKTAPETKLKWKGNQKQFGELIDQLQEKEWIDKIKDGDLSSIVRNLCSCFDLSQTKKKDTSDIENSLRQILTPSEKDTRIYSKRYAKNFGNMSSNIQKKKK